MANITIIPPKPVHVDIVANMGGGSTPAIFSSLTYAALKSLRDGGSLQVGTYYRIIDYVTTTQTAYTKSANHPFDLIVFAVSSDTLSERAYAVLHEGDTYFKTCDLKAWEIRYCLDNDTSRFDWASNTGKGVIYYMQDEHNNIAPYDFKNILFSTKVIDRTKFTPSLMWEALKMDGSGSPTDLSPLLKQDASYYYTFATSGNTDASKNGTSYNNTIHSYKGGSSFYLPFIVLKNKAYNVSIGEGSHHITLQCYNSVYDITIGMSCYNLHFACRNFYQSTIENCVHNIAFCGVYNNTSSDLWANHWSNNCKYMAYYCTSHFRCNHWAERNIQHLFYGQMQVNYFGAQCMNIAFVNNAVITSVATPDFSAVKESAYYLYNRFGNNITTLNITIPNIFDSIIHSGTNYLTLNQDTSTTNAFGTPAQYVEVHGADYGTKEALGQFAPANYSPSTTALHKKGAVVQEI